MKVIYELDPQEDRYEHAIYHSAPDMAHFITEFRNYLRELIKRSEAYPDMHFETVEKIRTQFFELIEEYNLPEEIT